MKRLLCAACAEGRRCTYTLAAKPVQASVPFGGFIPFEPHEGGNGGPRELGPHRSVTDTPSKCSRSTLSSQDDDRALPPGNAACVVHFCTSALTIRREQRKALKTIHYDQDVPLPVCRRVASLTRSTDRFLYLVVNTGFFLYETFGPCGGKQGGRARPVE
jgi:hypothetical protein